MPNRTICSIIEEARKCHETRNYSYLPGLLEEIQSAANRMEASLWDQKDLERLRSDRKELQEEIKQLKEERKLIVPELPKEPKYAGGIFE
jgi:uncharacterized coiled-coil DUF342 family protein